MSEVDNDVIIGFDAHNPKSLKELDVYKEIIDYLKSLNITPIDTIDFKK